MLLNGFSLEDVLLDDPLKDLRGTRMVPDPIGIDDGDRPFTANAKAIGLRAHHPHLPIQIQLL